MSDVAFHLVKRGLDITSQYTSRVPKDDEEAHKIPTWGLAILATTAVTYLVVMLAVCIGAVDDLKRRLIARRYNILMA